MYGSYGLYSGNRSNFSSATNLYRPAGVINIQAGSTAQTGTVSGTGINLVNGKGTDGTVVGVSSTPQTGIISTLTQYGTSSVALMTDTSYSSQHVDYEQNPSTGGVHNSTQDSVIPVNNNTNTNNIPITSAQAYNPLVIRGQTLAPERIGFFYSYTAGMILPVVNSTVTVTGVDFNGSLNNGFNGTFTVYSTATQGIVYVYVTILPPVGTPTTPNTGVLSFTP